MIAAGEFCGLLQARGFTFYTGVPCSTFKSAINHILGDRSLTYVMAANEGAALGIAAGAWLAGRKAAVMLQNSGVGNLVNPLTSLASPYRIPLLLFISGRAYPDGTGDEPQHCLMGATVRQLLASYDVHRVDMPADAAGFAAALDDAEAAMRERRVAAIMVPDGRIQSGGAAPAWHRNYPLTRQSAIEIVARLLAGTDAVVSTTGKISRQLFASQDRCGNFYMQGSMGHARAIALGIALVDPRRTVVVIDGDGAALMHLGTLSTVGHYAPHKLIDIVLDNEAHGSTGNQDTTSSTTELAIVAKACNYRRAWHCTTGPELDAALQEALASDGPSFLLVKVNRNEADLPRITSVYSPDEITNGFRDFLRRQ